jgi:hypothetical protein
MTSFRRLLFYSTLFPSIGQLNKLEENQSTETKMIKSIKLSSYEKELNELTHKVPLTAMGKLKQATSTYRLKIYKGKECLSMG